MFDTIIELILKLLQGLGVCALIAGGLGLIIVLFRLATIRSNYRHLGRPAGWHPVLSELVRSARQGDLYDAHAEGERYLAHVAALRAAEARRRQAWHDIDHTRGPTREGHQAGSRLLDEVYEAAREGFAGYLAGLSDRQLGRLTLFLAEIAACPGGPAACRAFLEAERASVQAHRYVVADHPQRLRDGFGLAAPVLSPVLVKTA